MKVARNSNKHMNKQRGRALSADYLTHQIGVLLYQEQIPITQARTNTWRQESARPTIHFIQYAIHSIYLTIDCGEKAKLNLLNRNIAVNPGHYWIIRKNLLTFLDNNFEICLIRPWLHLIERQSITSRFPCYETKAKSTNLMTSLY